MWYWLHQRALAAMVGAFGLLLVGLGALAAGSVPVRALTNCDTGDTSLDAQEQAFLGLINQYRAQNGLGGLSVSTNLNRAATWMTRDMASKGYFSHTDSLGRAPYNRALDCGYPQGAGENLAAGGGWDTAQAAFDAWKASPGHNANMLGSYYLQIGISRYYLAGSPYGWYWATNFGATNDGTGGPPPPPPATNTPPPATNTPPPAPTSTPPAPTSTPPGPTTTPPAAATSTPTPAANTPTPAPTSAPTTAPTSTSASPTTAAPTSTPRPAATSAPTSTPTPAPASGGSPGSSLPLQPGANLVAWPGNDAPPDEALRGMSGIVAIYAYDASAGRWLRYVPGLPSFVNNLSRVHRGQAYWFISSTKSSLPIVN